MALPISYFMDTPSDELAPLKGRPLSEGVKQAKRRMVMVTLGEFLLKPIPQKPPNHIEPETHLRHSTKDFLPT